MKTIIERQFAKFAVSRLEWARSGMMHTSAALGGVLSVATGCSGSEVLFHVLDLLVNFWQAMWGITFRVRHLFATEIVEWKQRWICSHWQPEAVFADIEAFRSESSVCLDVLTNKLIPVPQADLWVCGFECDSASGLNHRSAENRGCVARASGKTGSTAQGCMAYIRRWRPSVFILENVKNINASPSRGSGAGQPPDPQAGGRGDKKPVTDLEFLRAELSSYGYVVWSEVLSASEFGVPQSRARYYIVGYKVSDEGPRGCCAASRVSADSEEPRWSHLARLTVRDAKIPPLPVSAFLLPAGDPKLDRLKAGNEHQPKRSKRSSAKEDDVFACDHLQAFQAHDLRWPPEWGGAFAAKTAGLPRRQQELVFIMEHIHKAELDLGIELWADVNFSIAWCQARRKVTPCIVCGSRIWGLTLGRELCAEELLALQGFSHAAQGDTMQWAPKQLVDLAGNAFNGAVVAAVLTASLAAYPWQPRGGPTLGVRAVCGGAEQPAEPTGDTDGESCGLEESAGSVRGRAADEDDEDLRTLLPGFYSPASD